MAYPEPTNAATAIVGHNTTFNALGNQRLRVKSAGTNH